jgi:uncharacterized membrane protein
MPEPQVIATGLPGRPLDTLDERTQRVARHIAGHRLIARNLAEQDAAPASRGQRAADAVAAFGGSWTFVALFGAAMVAWVLLNALLLWRQGSTFDPYPYILLNLFLSMVAAIQAPIILMSQNRQAERDRLSAAHDYEVNLKAELEIMLLHDKLDQLRDKQWQELLAIQQLQLNQLAALRRSDPPAPDR